MKIKIIPRCAAGPLQAQLCELCSPASTGKSRELYTKGSCGSCHNLCLKTLSTEDGRERSQQFRAKKESVARRHFLREQQHRIIRLWASQICYLRTQRSS